MLARNPQILIFGETRCFIKYAIPSTRDAHIQLRRPRLYRVPSNTPHVLQEPQASHAHIPISPCQNPKIRVAGFLVLAKPSLSGAKPSLSGAKPSLSEAMPRLSGAKASLSGAKPSFSGTEAKSFRSRSQVFQEQRPSFSGAEAKFFGSRSQVLQEQKPSLSGAEAKFFRN